MRTTALFAAALFLLSACATTPGRPVRGEPLTSEAKAMLARALADPQSNGAVVDVAAFEEVGLGSRDDALKSTMAVIEAALPFVVSEADEEDRAAAARFTIATAVLREWAEWPNVRGMAFKVGRLDGENPVADSVIVLALAQGEEKNRELLTGIIALGRTIAGQDGSHTLEIRSGDACIVSPDDPPLCVRSGNGFVLMGTPEAMQAYAQSPAPTVEDAAVPVLLRARASMPGQGAAELVIAGRDAVALQANLQATSPVLLAKAEQTVQELLQQYDVRRQKQRAAIEVALAEMKRELATDAQAPASMKSSVETLTVDRVLDPDGHWAQLRSSVKSERAAGTYRFAMTIPAGAVKEISQLAQSGGADGIYAIGMVSAIAVPNFMKFQCRSKQSEVRAILKSIYVAQRAHAAERKQWGRSFAELGVTPESNHRYTYCMGQECIACTHEECAPARTQNPCTGMSGVGRTLEDGFQVCAFANVDDDEKLDIWLIDDNGRPEAGENDCE
ncbi:MAG: hypothetical protein WBV82_31400 [Myxococcaceae bacterium]